MLLLDLDEIPDLHARLRWFSWRRFNMFSFHEQDHADGTTCSPRDWVRAHLAGAGIDCRGGAIRLLAMPRVLGYAFNPISLYFCYHADGTLRAIMHEVHNTFGERHSYLIPVAQVADGADVEQSCAKDFHVSPFMAMGMRYEFRIHPPDDRFSLTINSADDDGPVLAASFTARRRAMSDAALLRAFVAMPFVTLKVIAGIHWEAGKLWRKGLRLHPRPPHTGHPVRIVSALPVDRGASGTATLTVA